MKTWIKAPFGSGPAGLGATPMLVEKTWWVATDGITYSQGLAGGSGFGDLPAAQSAAADLMAFFATNAPSRDSIPQVGAFQRAYNTSGLPGSLTPDEQYGPFTQVALNNVIGPSQLAPQNVFSDVVPSTPEPDAPPTPVPGGSTTPTVAPSTSSTGGIPTPVIIGGAAVLGAGLIYWAYRRKKHHR
jgi:hypothetical protein